MTSGGAAPAAEQGPAVDYGCGLSRHDGMRRDCGNPACHPDGRPCSAFMGGVSDSPEYDYWCPRCGWAVWAHPSEQLRPRANGMLAIHDNRLPCYCSSVRGESCPACREDNHG